MNIEARHIGKVTGKPSKGIEVTATIDGVEYVEDVTFINGQVDVDFIDQLRTLADELEEQNMLYEQSINPAKSEIC